MVGSKGGYNTIIILYIQMKLQEKPLNMMMKILDIVLIQLNHMLEEMEYMKL